MALVVALVVVAVVLGLFLLWNRAGFGTAPVAVQNTRTNPADAPEETSTPRPAVPRNVPDITENSGG